MNGYYRDVLNLQSNNFIATVGKLVHVEVIFNDISMCYFNLIILQINNLLSIRRISQIGLIVCQLIKIKRLGLEFCNHFRVVKLAHKVVYYRDLQNLGLRSKTPRRASPTGQRNRILHTPQLDATRAVPSTRDFSNEDLKQFKGDVLNFSFEQKSVTAFFKK